jgi:hypothetical protein
VSSVKNNYVTMEYWNSTVFSIVKSVSVIFTLIYPLRLEEYLPTLCYKVRFGALEANQ